MPFITKNDLTMLSTKKLRFLLVLLFVSLVFSTGAKASSVSIRDLQNEINLLKQRIGEIEDKKTSSLSPDLQGVDVFGSVRIQLLKHNNDGSAFGALGGDVAASRLPNLQGTNLRLGAIKRISDMTKFVFELYMDKEDGVKFRSIYFTFDLTDHTLFTFGQQYIDNFAYYGLDNIDRSSLPNNVRFERMADLFPDRAMGVSFAHLYDRAGIYYGIYGNAIEDSTTEKNQVIANAKAYFVPAQGDNGLIHLGLSNFYKNEEFKRALLVQDVPSRQFTFDMRHLNKSSVELGVLYNNFMFLSEYDRARIEPTALREAFYVDSYYLQGSLVLTGESYLYQYGKFKRFEVANPFNKGGLGAFEVAYRFANTDGFDKRGVNTFDYGKYVEHVASLNWSATDNFTILLSHSFVKETFESAGMAVVNGGRLNRYEITQLDVRIFF
ncbi:MAG: hypothetical protein LBG48_00635 [Rickettsiales bacterium]|jgi:phosphate-selective porin|nr:hypothetical protein [Rickettsiales bacterium]